MFNQNPFNTTFVGTNASTGSMRAKRTALALAAALASFGATSAFADQFGIVMNSVGAPIEGKVEARHSGETCVQNPQNFALEPTGEQERIQIIWLDCDVGPNKQTTELNVTVGNKQTGWVTIPGIVGFFSATTMVVTKNGFVNFYGSSGDATAGVALQ